MSGGFGWSLGDVVLLAKTTHRVVHALSQNDGASSEYRKAKRSLESLQATLAEIKSILLNSEPGFRGAIKNELDDTTSSIAAFNDRILEKYGNTLGSASSQGACLGVWRKLKWEFVAAEEFAGFQIELSRQFEKVKLLMVMQLSKMVSTVMTTTSESHDFLVSGLREWRMENAKTLSTIQEVRNGLTPASMEPRNLPSVNHKPLLGSKEDLGMISVETKADISTVSNEMAQQLPFSIESSFQSRGLECTSNGRAFSPGSSRTLHGEASSGQKSLVQAIHNVENVIMDVGEHQDCHARRTCSEQAQQYLQVQQGIEDIKGLFQVMKRETHGLGTDARSTLSLPVRTASVQRGHDFLPRQSKQLISFVQVVLRDLYMLILYLLPQTCLFLRTLHTLSLDPLEVPSGGLIRFQDVLGGVRLFNSAHFCHFEVFEAFLRKEVIGKPVETHVLKDQYRIIDARDQGKLITKSNWRTEVSAGSDLVMALTKERDVENPELCVMCRSPSLICGSTGSRHCTQCNRTYSRRPPGHTRFIETNKGLPELTCKMVENDIMNNMRSNIQRGIPLKDEKLLHNLRVSKVTAAVTLETINSTYTDPYYTYLAPCGVWKCLQCSQPNNRSFIIH